MTVVASDVAAVRDVVVIRKGWQLPGHTGLARMKHAENARFKLCTKIILYGRKLLWHINLLFIIHLQEM